MPIRSTINFHADNAEIRNVTNRISILVCLLATACAGSPPFVETVNPAVAEVGQAVRVSGLGFGDVFGDTEDLVLATRQSPPERHVISGHVTSWSDTLIEFRLPLNFLDADSERRDFDLHVESAGMPSNVVAFEIAPPPTPVIERVTPPSSPPGTEISILGQDFGLGAGRIWFGTSGLVPVEATSWAATEIRVIVPSNSVGDSLRVESSVGEVSEPVTFRPAEDPAGLSAIQRDIFTPRCALSGCHGEARAAGLSLEDGSSYESLVGVRSSQDPDTLLVVPSSPSDSLLFAKISDPEPQVGSRMPLSGEALSAEEIELIRTWIARGANE